jgi:hypothetical protein
MVIQAAYHVIFIGPGQSTIDDCQVIESTSLKSDKLAPVQKPCSRKTDRLLRGVTYDKAKQSNRIKTMQYEEINLNPTAIHVLFALTNGCSRHGKQGPPQAAMHSAS